MRALPSGRYQVRYLGPDGVRRAAPRTFATKADARRWLTLTESDITRGAWVDESEKQGMSVVANELDLAIAQALEAKGLTETAIRTAVQSHAFDVETYQHTQHARLAPLVQSLLS